MESEENKLYDIFCTIIGFIVIVCCIGFLGGGKDK